MAKVIVYLREEELNALCELATREYRTPKAQDSMLIRDELERQRLLEKREEKTW
jgi:hypothetical protein